VNIDIVFNFEFPALPHALSGTASANHRFVYVGDSEHYDAPLPMTIHTIEVIIICNSVGKGCKMLASVGKCGILRL
jgi:hypothetical protein